MTAMLESPTRETEAPKAVLTEPVVAEPVLTEPAEPVLEAPVPGVPAARTVPRRPRRVRTALSVHTARMAALLMVAGFVIGAGLEPAPTGPAPVLPFWADALGNATLVVLLGSWAALAAGRRSGLWLGVVAGAGLVTETALCPALDHHLIAGWWWAQLGISLGITAVNAALLARTRPSRRSAARF